MALPRMQRMTDEPSAPGHLDAVAVVTLRATDSGLIRRLRWIAVGAGMLILLTWLLTLTDPDAFAQATWSSVMLLALFTALPWWLASVLSRLEYRLDAESITHVRQDVTVSFRTLTRIEIGRDPRILGLSHAPTLALRGPDTSGTDRVIRLSGRLLGDLRPVAARLDQAVRARPELLDTSQRGEWDALLRSDWK